jgi:hypothetical protein
VDPHPKKRFKKTELGPSSADGRGGVDADLDLDREQAAEALGRWLVERTFAEWRSKRSQD